MGQEDINELLDKNPSPERRIQYEAKMGIGEITEKKNQWRTP